jgi:fermentation-respiration switch protein FrsA (DUF1100 family)
VVRLLIAVIVGGLVLKGIVSALEPKLVFFPYKGENDSPASFGVPYQTIRIDTADGERLVAWQLEPARPVADVVYFHGNGGNLSVWLPILASLARLQLRVLAIDYRGYGLSTGTPSEDGVYRDADAVVRYAATHRPAGSARPLVFWGRSLGGAVAASATRVVTPDGLILESTFVDKAAVVRAHPVLRMLNVFASYRFATAEMLKDYRNPVLVMHGDRDSVIPHALGRELYERLSPPKQLVSIAGGDHNDLFDASRTAYWQPVLDFIARLSPA